MTSMATMTKSVGVDGDGDGDVDQAAKKLLAFQNKILAGRVMHTRKTTPLHHSFVYHVFMMYLQIGPQTPSLFDSFVFWSSRDQESLPSTSTSWISRLLKRCLPVLARFSPKDHLSEDQVRKLLASRNATSASERLSKVFLLTNFRYFGLLFNPISVYFCYDADANLLAIVDEVTNTPWGERIHYVHDLTLNYNKTHIHTNIDGDEANENTSKMRRGFEFEIRYPKAMHVSPFFEMDYEYRSGYNTPTDHFSMQIELLRKPSKTSTTTLTALASPPIEHQHQQEETHQESFTHRKVEATTTTSTEHQDKTSTTITTRPPVEFVARLDLKESLPLTQWNLLKILWRFPFMTAQVVWGIYWQALKLWWKGAIFYPHPGSEPSKSIGRL
eukprot:TRINITY_DN14614_c0_g1_i1.p1 TRINITY_DN14614_c0_g1~~TRINITY_DN14614_c0_g1_i1.p1  ORF type:complete len:386 (-),score=79.41 TRINITY_DN14614_c0_g1_i1:35-1192(-)